MKKINSKLIKIDRRKCTMSKTTNIIFEDHFCKYLTVLMIKIVMHYVFAEIIFKN